MYYLAKKYFHTLGQSSFIDQIVLIVQIQITQYFVWPPWAAITATIRRGILSQSFSRYSGVTCLHTFLASFSPFLIMTFQLQTSVISKRLKLEQRDCAHMKDLLMQFQSLIRFFTLSCREVVLLGFKGAQKINAPLFLHFRK